jgi:hypothetical protein
MLKDTSHKEIYKFLLAYRRNSVNNVRKKIDIHKYVHLQIYSLGTNNKMSLFSIDLFK